MLICPKAYEYMDIHIKKADKIIVYGFIRAILLYIVIK